MWKTERGESWDRNNRDSALEETDSEKLSSDLHTHAHAGADTGISTLAHIQMLQGVRSSGFCGCCDRSTHRDEDRGTGLALESFRVPRATARSAHANEGPRKSAGLYYWKLLLEVVSQGVSLVSMSIHG